MREAGNVKRETSGARTAITDEPIFLPLTFHVSRFTPPLPPLQAGTVLFLSAHVKGFSGGSCFVLRAVVAHGSGAGLRTGSQWPAGRKWRHGDQDSGGGGRHADDRSEERRVGEECR